MDLCKKINELTLREFFTELEARYGPQLTRSSEQVDVDFMNVKECAQLTGYAPDYIRQLVFKRAIPFHKNPNRKPVRFKRFEILAWMATKKFIPIDEQAENYITDKHKHKKS
jgi:excisionase family DNA binding protein